MIISGNNGNISGDNEPSHMTDRMAASSPTLSPPTTVVLSNQSQLGYSDSSEHGEQKEPIVYKHLENVSQGRPVDMSSISWKQKKIIDD